MILEMLFFLPGFFSQVMVPVMYGPDPVEMARQMGAVHQQIMANNMAMQRHIFNRNKAVMDKTPADGKLHTYENKIPGGMSRGSSYHNKGPNHEEFSETHSSSQSFGTPPFGTDDDFTGFSDAGSEYSSSSNEAYAQPSSGRYTSGSGKPYFKTFSEKLPGGSGRGHVYENSGPGFHEYSTSYSSAQNFGSEPSSRTQSYGSEPTAPRTIPVATERTGAREQTYVRPASSTAEKTTYVSETAADSEDTAVEEAAGRTGATASDAYATPQ